jgi:hypothetical protein
MPKNAQCHVSDSELCRWIDKDCGDCYIDGLKHKDDSEKMLSDFRVTLSLLPEDFDTLQGDECGFCKGETKKPRAGYAIIDLAHSEPESKKGMFFGLGKKVRQRIGSLMPVSISICRSCRRNLRMAEYLKWIVVAALVGLAIGLCFIPAINAIPALPYGVVIAGFLAGYLLSRLVSDAYMKAKSRETAFNVFEIPVCRKMQEAGWFVMQDSGPASRFIMSRKPYTKKLSGLCNAGPEAPAEIEKAPAAED